ncbi:hypothetical protein [Stenotrophomonas sp. MMGLT7]|uniref:hypothetical protein n=1 Tax=Stenotrophomonas sp. MMGLT7 TaxID=2901227 RepID=UPI001E4FB236|nr:hypothetical protein [Stenotrophomonas sp. MMGLT7]MCD7099390.1 hypothetical protein [Stenotrophomonas sp. MMGLT7]
MKANFLAVLLLTSCFAYAEVPSGSEIFTPETLSKGMSVESDGYKFEVEHSRDGTYLLARASSGKINKVKLPEAGLSNMERLFYVSSNGCGGKSVDAVIQIGPESHADLEFRSFYRIIFSRDLSSVISEFFDPSVSVVNAVLPIQTVEGIEDKETKEKIVCEGSKPIVKARK